ncbi:oligosaccharide flippase family protein [Photobacterium damselae]|uniref:oligosaccharide flippase family protein n=1 Tax=Photobacterium damselae TaxID=38293 RepID=UPI0030F3C218
MLKKIISNSSIYLLSNILASLVPFLLIPILTEKLTPAEFGVVSMFQILILVFNSLIGFNVNAAVERFFFEKENQVSKFIGASVIILICTSILLFIFIYPLRFYISDNTNIPVNWLYFALFCSFFNFIILLRLGQWQVRTKSIKYGLLQLFRTILNFGLSLIFIYKLEMTADSRLYGIFISSLIVAFISLYLLFKDKLIVFNGLKKDDFYQLMIFGIPLIPHVISNLLLNNLDRIVVNDFLGVDAVGVYMLAVQFGLLINTVSNSLNKAIAPPLFKYLTDSVNLYKINFFIYSLMFICIFFVIISYFIAPELIIYFSDERYHEASNFIFYIFFGQIVSSYNLLLSNLFLFYKKTKYLSYGSILSGGLNILLLVLFVQEIGLTGAAIAFLISKLFQLFLSLLFIKNSNDISWVLKYKVK